MSSPATKQLSKLLLKVNKLSSDALALSNKVFVHPDDYKSLKASISSLGDFVLIRDWVFTIA
jgi:hypothetical protein